MGKMDFDGGVDDDGGELMDAVPLFGREDSIVVAETVA